MIEFGVHVPTDNDVTKYFIDMDHKLEEGSVFSSPYEGSVAMHIGREWSTFHVRIRPLYPPVYWVGIIYLVAVYLLSANAGFWLYFPGVAIVCMIVFWIPRFYYLMILIGFAKRHIQVQPSYMQKKDVIAAFDLLNILIKPM